MSKAVKAMMTDDLRRRYSGVSNACVVDMTGMDVQQQEKFRKALREKSAKVEVVRNSLARRALVGQPLGPLADALEGPSVLITTPDSPIEVAKFLVSATKEFATLKLKKAMFDGDAALLTVEELSRMRGKREILGEIAMLISAPGRALAGCLAGPQARIAGCLKAMADNGGD